MKVTLQRHVLENFRYCRWGAEQRVSRVRAKCLACAEPGARTPISTSGNVLKKIIILHLSIKYLYF